MALVQYLKRNNIQKFPCIKVESVITAQASASGTAIYEKV